MTRRQLLDDMDPAERLPAVFNYAKELEAGETIVGPVTLTPRLIEGVDATPGQFIDGAPLVQATSVVQRVAGRIDGNTYELQCDAPTSLGNVRTLIVVQRVRKVSVQGV